MKNRKITFIITVVIVFTLLLSVLSANVGASDNDPLVTLSYINETVIPKITEQVKSAVLAVIDEKYTVDDQEQTEIVEPEPEAEPAVPAVTEEQLSVLKYNVIHLEKGQKLFATGTNTESTEIILRAGSVVCISPFGDQGIADLTASKELYNNDTLIKNNYCLIPRGSDGRGIYAADSDAYILVRGEYEIVQE